MTEVVHDLDFLVLHVLRVKGIAPVGELARATGADVGAARACVAELVESGYVVERSGAVAGLSLTPAGRERYAELVATRDVPPPELEALAQAYDRFLAYNERFKRICTRWQVRDDGIGPALPNDHTDPAYDYEVIGDVGDLNRRVTPVLDDLTAVVPRFAQYQERFANAWERLQDGRKDALAKPLSNSYHDVWMELHQDFLLSLGRTRSADDGD